MGGEWDLVREEVKLFLGREERMNVKLNVKLKILVKMDFFFLIERDCWRCYGMMKKEDLVDYS